MVRVIRVEDSADMQEFLGKLIRPQRGLDPDGMAEFSEREKLQGRVVPTVKHPRGCYQPRPRGGRVFSDAEEKELRRAEQAEEAAMEEEDESDFMDGPQIFRKRKQR